MLYKNDFAELAKRGDRTAAAPFPERLVAFANSGAQLLPRHGSQVLALLVLVKAPFRWPAVPPRNVGKMIFVAFGRRESVKPQKPAGQTGGRRPKVYAQARPDDA